MQLFPRGWADASRLPLHRELCCHLALWGSRVILPTVLITHRDPLPSKAEMVWILEGAAIFLSVWEFGWSRCRRFETFCTRCWRTFRNGGEVVPVLRNFQFSENFGQNKHNRWGKVWWKDQGLWAIQTGCKSFPHHFLCSCELIISSLWVLVLDS